MSKIFSYRVSRKTGFSLRSKHFVDFAKEEQGTVTVESVIVLPILLVGLMSLFSFFDFYRQQAYALRANYAISDYLSRVYEYDAAAVTGLDKVFKYIAQADNTSWIRISVVLCEEVATKCNDATNRELVYMKDDSTAVRTVTFTTNAEMIAAIGDAIPNMYQYEYLVVVETGAQYKKIFSGRWTGLFSNKFKNTVVTKPREYSYPCYETASKECVDPNV